MAYSRNWVCPRSHPVQVPRLRFIVTYPIEERGLGPAAREQRRDCEEELVHQSHLEHRRQQRATRRLGRRSKYAALPYARMGGRASCVACSSQVKLVRMSASHPRGLDPANSWRKVPPNGIPHTCITTLKLPSPAALGPS